MTTPNLWLLPALPTGPAIAFPQRVAKVARLMAGMIDLRTDAWRSVSAKADGCARRATGAMPPGHGEDLGVFTMKRLWGESGAGGNRRPKSALQSGSCFDAEMSPMARGCLESVTRWTHRRRGSGDLLESEFLIRIQDARVRIRTGMSGLNVSGVLNLKNGRIGGYARI